MENVWSDRGRSSLKLSYYLFNKPSSQEIRLYSNPKGNGLYETVEYIKDTKANS